MGKQWKHRETIFLGSNITADGDCSHEIKRHLLLGRKVMTNLNNILKSKRHHFVNKGPSSQGYGFSNSYVWMWELDYKKSWAPKNRCFWTVVLEKTLESTLESKEIKPVNPKGSQSWIFIGRTDAEAEYPILWPPDVKNWLIGKDPDAGKAWRQEKRLKKDKMVGWYHRLDGHEFEQAPGDDEGQGSLVWCRTWGHKELDTTDWLNNSNKGGSVVKNLPANAGDTGSILGSERYPGVGNSTLLQWKWKWNRSVVSNSLRPHGL